MKLKKITRKASDAGRKPAVITSCSDLPPEIVMQDAFNVILWTSADICIVHDDLWRKNRTTRYYFNSVKVGVYMVIFSPCLSVHKITQAVDEFRWFFLDVWISIGCLDLGGDPDHDGDIGIFQRNFYHLRVGENQRILLKTREVVDELLRIFITGVGESHEQQTTWLQCRYHDSTGARIFSTGVSPLRDRGPL